MTRRVLFHRASALAWALMLIPALLWWKGSLVFVIVASVYANVKSDWGAAEAADDAKVTARLLAIEDRVAALGTPGDPGR